MIKLIIGAKGSGKTKKIHDMANAAVENSNGDIVYIDCKDDHMYSLNYRIRLLNSNDYEIETDLGLYGFVRGLIAGNNDITTIFMDGIKKMTKKPLDELEEFFGHLIKLGNSLDTDFVLTVSCAEEELPGYLKKMLEKKEAVKI